MFYLGQWFLAGDDQRFHKAKSAGRARQGCCLQKESLPCSAGQNRSCLSGASNPSLMASLLLSNK